MTSDTWLCYYSAIILYYTSQNHDSPIIGLLPHFLLSAGNAVLCDNNTEYFTVLICQIRFMLPIALLQHWCYAEKNMHRTFEVAECATTLK